MTPTELEQMARERYNAVGETFWSSAEMRNLMYAACVELGIETECIERTYSTTTVADTAEYEFPTNIVIPKRVTYYGAKLEPINMRQGDALTLNQNGVTTTGTPQWYSQFNNTFTLYPTPNDAQELKVWGIVEPQQITTASTELESPTWTHARLVNYMLSEMYAKDKDFGAADKYRGKWEQDKLWVKRVMKTKRRGDSPAQVLDEEHLPKTLLGLI